MKIKSVCAKINSFMRKNGRWYLLAAFLVPILGILIAYIKMGIRPFGTNSMLGMDLWSQYFPMLRQQYLSRRELAMDLFSWNGALGVDTYVQNAYYCNSPFNFLLLLAPMKYLVDALDYLILLKFGLAGLNFAIYCRYRFKKADLFTAACAAGYALCSYCLAFISQIMWFDAVVFFPIILMGFERLMHEKKPMLYCLMLAVTMYSGFYISFSVCIFLAIYFCVFAAEHASEFKLRGILSCGIRFSVFSVLAAGLAAFVLLPVYFGLSTTIASDIPAPTTPELYHSFWDFFANTLPLTEASLQFGVPNIYSGCFVLVMLPLFFMNKGIALRRRIIYGVLCIFLVLSMNLNYLDYLWHGLHFPNQLPGRWTFMFSFVLMIICYELLRHLDRINYISLAVSGGLAAFAIVAAKFFSKEQTVSKYSLLLGIFFAAMYLFLLFIILRTRKDNEGVKTFRVLLAVCMLVEMFSNSTVVIGQSIEIGDVPKYVGYNEDMDWFSETYASPKDDFYRTDMYYNWTFDHCQLFRIKGITYYSSTMSGGAYNFFKDVGYRVYAKNVSTVYCPYSPVLNSVLNMGYVADLAMQYYPDYLVDEGSHGKIRVLKNEKCLPAAYAASDDILSWQNNGTVPFYEEQNRFLSALTGMDGNVFVQLPDGEIETKNADIKTPKSDWTQIMFSRISSDAPVSIKYTFKIEQDGPVYMCHNYKKGDMEVKVNDKQVNIVLYREPLKFLGELKKGDVVTVNITVSGVGVGLAGLSLFRFDREKFENCYDFLAAGGTVNVRDTGKGLSFEIDNDESRLIFTTVPAQNMTCYVDGEKTWIETVDGYLAAVRLNAGHHEVEFRYSVRGLLPGAAVSAVCLCALAALTAFGMMKKKKKGSVELDGLEIK
ncbi:MAG: YfhO family protein [Clostridia bacterium]|nr:YfhO family protein [Clostridia bacterium]